MEQPMRVYAAAKLNLTLDILGRRPDGYHLLDMVMQTVSIYDTLLLTPTQHPGVDLLCDRAGIPCGEENTVRKAARLFFQQAGIRGGGLRIQILKRIPDQAGMGGGSADAAAVLRTMNRMYHAGFTMDELCKLGLKVGADVPFCLRGGTMRAEGIGEILTHLTPMPQCFFVVCKPSVGVSTAAAFAQADRDGASYPRFTPAMTEALAAGELPRVAGGLGNSFTLALPLPQIEELRQTMLRRGALGACMTGSGSAVFGIFSERVPAERCREALREEYRSVFVCEPVGAESY
ncbi:4-(cytidine 5'-diphospho)-2-C-methyl-D-erythritol kinase [Faecalispora anaeroviscerum]|uniref:4-(cytidine 5'-diphospho)-2-C-methyl-D-erythritol kinase n=1 Tax=Faecalispora anaeroviscerum TaxID=2991836 RepID=UPI0024B8E0C3|nr:4-(cytidine 5'-diphospho)-2-C-methyl-D-erythritol kinase [Faecalispora anaeroviscerum]